MLPDIKAEILVWIITTAVPVATMYITNKGKIKEAEHRMTVLEMKVGHAEEKITHNISRLDDHDDQNRVMFAMVEQVKSLTKTLEEVKQDIKKLTVKDN